MPKPEPTVAAMAQLIGAELFRLRVDNPMRYPNDAVRIAVALDKEFGFSEGDEDDEQRTTETNQAGPRPAGSEDGCTRGDDL